MSNQRKGRRSKAPGWIFVGLGMAGIACALPYIPKNGDASGPIVALLVGGGLSVVIGGFLIYDSLPLPNDPIAAPPPLRLVQTEPWRVPTELRCLEALKEQLSGAESSLSNLHKSASTAYQELIRCNGRFAYFNAKSDKSFAEACFVETEKTIAVLKRRINNLYRGDTSQELLEIEAQIKKLLRRRAEYQSQIQASERCNINHESVGEERECSRKRASTREDLRSMIHDIDVEVIEQETHQKELKTFDFHRIWKDLKQPVPAGVADLSEERLRDLKGKATIITEIPEIRRSKVAPTAPPPSNEEQRLKHKARIEEKLKRLKIEQKERMDRADTEEERRRWENTYEEEMRRSVVELKRYL